MAGAATVEKALDVLFHLHGAESALRASARSPAPSASRSRAATACSCPSSMREVVEQDEAGRYRPGLALLALGLGVQRREPVVDLARDCLEAEAAELGETVFLVAERPGTAARARQMRGQRIPARGTGGGRRDPRRRDRGREALPGASRGPVIAVPTTSGRARGDPAPRLCGESRCLDRRALGIGRSDLAARAGGGRSKLAAVLALAAASPRFDAIGEARIAERLLAAAAEVAGRLGIPSQAAARWRGPKPRARMRGAANQDGNENDNQNGSESDGAADDGARG